MKKISFLLIILVTLIFVSPTSFAATGNMLDGSKYVVTNDENFNKIFREGRDLIDQREWEKAAAKFNEIVCDCPEKKGVDAAFYWLAFSYKKQNKFKEMGVAIDRLVKNFPQSSWVDDAQVMNFENVRVTVNGTAMKPAQASTVYSTQNLASALATTSQSALPREDEIKLAAFQSLLSANPQRAIELLADILKSDSKASEALKSRIITTLRGHGFSAVYTFSYPSSSYSNDLYAAGQNSVAAGGFSTTGTATRIQALSAQNKTLLQDVLFKSYKVEPSVKVRREMITTLSSLNDEQSLNNFVQLYYSEENKALKRMFINSLGNMMSFSFTTGQNQNPVEVKVNKLNEAKFDKLSEILRTEKDSELRILALSNLQRHPGSSNKEKSAGILLEMYDSEKDENLKISIIRLLASVDQNQTVTKLISIAKNETSDKLRLEAIRALQNSKNPEALKLLEELIK